MSGVKLSHFIHSQVQMKKDNKGLIHLNNSLTSCIIKFYVSIGRGQGLVFPLKTVCEDHAFVPQDSNISQA